MLEIIHDFEWFSRLVVDVESASWKSENWGEIGEIVGR